MTANIITGSRILFSAALVLLPTGSAAFGILYLLCGLSDMADGFVARKTHTESETGARLDSIADIVFITVCAAKILPLLHLSPRVWIWIGAIAFIKLINIASGLICHGKLVMPHTAANKLTGLMLFLLPAAMQWIDIRYPVIIICAAVTFAAIEEGYLIRKG